MGRINVEAGRTTLVMNRETRDHMFELLRMHDDEDARKAALLFAPGTAPDDMGRVDLVYWNKQDDGDQDNGFFKIEITYLDAETQHQLGDLLIAAGSRDSIAMGLTLVEANPLDGCDRCAERARLEAELQKTHDAQAKKWEAQVKRDQKAAAKNADA